MNALLLNSDFLSKIEDWSLLRTLLICLIIVVIGVVISLIISLIRKAAGKKDKTTKNTDSEKESGGN